MTMTDVAWRVVSNTLQGAGLPQSTKRGRFWVAGPLLLLGSACAGGRSSSGATSTTVPAHVLEATIDVAQGQVSGAKQLDLAHETLGAVEGQRLADMVNSSPMGHSAPNAACFQTWPTFRLTFRTRTGTTVVVFHCQASEPPFTLTPGQSLRAELQRITGYCDYASNEAACRQPG